MSIIQKIHAREILDSRGSPTIEVEVQTASAWARAAVPSGASTGAHEAHELRDGDKKRFHGKGVLTALENLRNHLAPSVLGMEVSDQVAVDRRMLEIDGTPNKSRLGANAILGISLACSKAAAMEKGQSWFRYLGGPKAQRLPVPLMNVLNGGAHANNGLDVQEFMIVPLVQNSFRESLRAGSEVFHSLKKILSEKGLSTAVGDEGGFAPKLAGNQEALEFVMQAIEKAGYRPGVDIFLALDVAATELYRDGHYTWENRKLSAEELLELYQVWIKSFPFLSIEDGFSEDDWAGWSKATKTLGKQIQLVGDDLFVTNVARLQKGISEHVANSLLVKVNQIGTLTETRAAVELAHNSEYTTVMSHRSGETEDVSISDLAVGLGCAQIKTGSLCRGERTAKYNQLLRIEEELGGAGRYAGRAAFSQS